MRTIFLILILSGCLYGFGQNVKKGYKFLEKSDYEKAGEVFSDILRDDGQQPAANFGIALILADEKSPLYNLIEAWGHVRNLISDLDKLSADDIETIGEYFVNTEERHTSRPVKKKIEYAVETIEAKLIKYIREENNLDIVYEVISRYPDFRHYDNVIHIRNQLEFRKYEKLNTLDGYLKFIADFPDAAQIDKAVRYRNKLAFEKASRENTVEAYKDYIKTYPDAAEYNQALKSLFHVAFLHAKQQNTIQAYDDYINAYPDALEIAEAKKLQKDLLYAYARQIHTLEAYNEFIRKYPEGEQFIDIFNLKSLDLGMRFITAHPLPSNNIQWARNFGKEGYSELDAVVAVDRSNSCFLGATSVHQETGLTDIWLLKLGPEGKMTWNIQVGEPYNDELIRLSMTNTDDLLGLGYTWQGTDSSSRNPWLFKIGSGGQKMWSKKLGDLYPVCLTCAENGTILIGGYEHTDSSGKKYAILVLNESGKKLWNRTYTGKGEIVRILSMPDQQLLLVGSHWCAKMDQRGYISWESLFGDHDQILASGMLQDGNIYYAGKRNQSKLVLIKTAADNRKIIEKELTLQDSLVSVNPFLLAGKDQMIGLFNYADHQVINWINTQTFLIEKSMALPDDVWISDIAGDPQGNLLLVHVNGSILLVKNAGSAF